MPTFSKSLIISILAVIAIFCAFNLALAQETGLKKPALQINIPTVSFGAEKGLWIGEYIRGIYQYAIGIVGILAAIVLMWGGVMWLTSGGNTGQVSEAKEWIKASLTGLVIALSSYTILYIINPDLTTFKSLNIESIEKTAATAESDASISETTLADSGVAVGKLTNAEAIAKLNSGIIVKNGASLENIRITTVDGLNAFQNKFGEPIVITSGTDGDHNSGTYSHAEGYKVDLRTNNNQKLVNYVTANGKSSGTISGFPAYTMDINNYNYRFLVESNHLDVRIIPK